MHGRTGHHDLQAVFELQLLHIAVGERLLVGADVARAVHDLAGNAVAAEIITPFAARARQKQLVEPLDKRHNRIALGERAERCIVGIFGHIRHVKQLGKLRQVALILVVKNADPLPVRTQIIL